MRFIEIDAETAFRMILHGDLSHLYKMLPDGSIDCVNNYRLRFDELTSQRYFRREAK